MVWTCALACCRVLRFLSCLPVVKRRRWLRDSGYCFRDARVLDELMGERTDSFLFHYNFPPYSVRRNRHGRFSKRREIGHGRLAKRGVLAIDAGHG
ncbi:hypothetical protein KCP77_04995 [Salmonella enterica subsp. enterica]|nr:hypothetical protein KCP77_04995 [Salmonella enterica subsp. enterica]